MVFASGLASSKSTLGIWEV